MRRCAPAVAVLAGQRIVCSGTRARCSRRRWPGLRRRRRLWCSGRRRRKRLVIDGTPRSTHPTPQMASDHQYGASDHRCLEAAIAPEQVPTHRPDAGVVEVATGGDPVVADAHRLGAKVTTLAHGFYRSVVRVRIQGGDGPCQARKSPADSRAGGPDARATIPPQVAPPRGDRMTSPFPPASA